MQCAGVQLMLKQLTINLLAAIDPESAVFLLIASPMN
jgi:hypothetical protein